MVRKQFQDAQFEHRLEIGEIEASLKGFSDKKELWEMIAKSREDELRKLQNVAVTTPVETIGTAIVATEGNNGGHSKNGACRHSRALKRKSRELVKSRGHPKGRKCNCHNKDKDE